MQYLTFSPQIYQGPLWSWLHMFCFDTEDSLVLPFYMPFRMFFNKYSLVMLHKTFANLVVGFSLSWTIAVTIFSLLQGTNLHTLWKHTKLFFFWKAYASSEVLFLLAFYSHILHYLWKYEPIELMTALRNQTQITRCLQHSQCIIFSLINTNKSSM